ncbi:MAG: quinol:cytochrome C oxidoreductase [Cyclobacteriaceae bacterium]|nr:quinol:cytochrome C oxidoreductase [Cytophagales bacterium]HNP78329.1 quinol:cytochrome C oxidoreductase [Cyclobacteriaceae bacterium]
MNASHTIAEEKYDFKSGTRSKLMILFVAGLLLFGLGVYMAMSGESHGAAEHASTAVSQNLVASVDVQEAHATEAAAEHHETAPWLKRIYSTLWMNNVFFTGLGIIGLFFIAIQYAAQAGWSVGVRRIPLAMGHWIPIAGVLMLVLWFVVKGDVFHWTHSSLYDANSKDYDEALVGKSGYFFWPLGAGAFPLFYIIRMVLFFGLWFVFFQYIKKEMLQEDMDGSVQHWYSARKLSAIFLVIFGVTSSVAAWDWVMSIDTHWFSTMMGWYVFASWWVTGLAMITFIVISLKGAGYLSIVNENHLHDLGKFVFAFSIFWTYIWFSQFMLIYYANIPEETVYFIQRRTVAPYSWIFFANLILNFVLPFLLLMTRDAKRQIATLQVVCPIIIVGHWLDFFNMITPGVVKGDGGLGLLEIGVAMMFLAAFLFVTLSSLTKFPLLPKHDPMLEESLGHHI